MLHKVEKNLNLICSLLNRNIKLKMARSPMATLIFIDGKPGRSESFYRCVFLVTRQFFSPWRPQGMCLIAKHFWQMTLHYQFMETSEGQIDVFRNSISVMCRKISCQIGNIHIIFFVHFYEDLSCLFAIFGFLINIEFLQKSNQEQTWII